MILRETNQSIYNVKKKDSKMWSNLLLLAGGIGVYKLLNSQPGKKKGIVHLGKIRSMNSLNIFNEKFTDEQEDKIVEVAQNIGVPPDWLVALMGFETMYTFSPSLWNQNGQHFVGLIQFGRTAAKGLGTTTAKLAKMSFIQQMDYVERYFTEENKHLLPLVNDIEDLYAIVIYPLSLRKSLDWICGSQVSHDEMIKVAKRNPLFKNDQGYMTRRSINKGLRAFYKREFPQYYDALFD